MSSTVSDSDPDPVPTPTPVSIPDPDIDVTARPAVVAWQSLDNHDLTLPQLTLDLHYNVHSNKAFFKLRCALALKTQPRSALKTNVFLFIHPERVRSIALDDSPSGAEAKMLGPDVTCLHFDLNRAPALVVPKGSLAPRNQASGNMLDSLRALAQQTTFSVYFSIPCRTLPRRRLLSLCEAASCAGLRSIDAYSDTTGLYAGNGGQVLECDSLGTSTASTATVNQFEAALEAPVENPPPSYDELPPKSQREGPSPSKRRRLSSPELSGGMDRKYIEDICAQLLDNRLANLKHDMAKQLEDLETRVMDYVDDKLGAQQEHITDDVGDKIEDEYYGLKLDLQSYVREEMEEAEGRIMDHIGSARISLQFNT
ncbi:hypothetical protein F5B20DRAFT_547028 [Whalleya microplaca]|nr:hypothetical protein F5B20DRAFT_547028 [Whalleya microplaca]